MISKSAIYSIKLYKLRYSLWCRLFFILCSFSALAQSQIETELSPEVILIGDTASLKITVTYDARKHVILPQVGDSLNKFIEITQQKIDSAQRGLNAHYIQRLTLTSFEAGDLLVNALPIIIDGDTLFTESKKLEVKTLDVDADLDNLLPIKPIVTEEITWWERNRKNVIYWAAGILLVIITLILVWWYIKNSKKSKYVSQPLLPPYEEALENLKKLDKQDYLNQNKYSEYYTDLSFIVRRYFTRRFEFPALALLSSDLPTIMQQKEILTTTEADEFTQFLKDSDLAKFARKVPPLEKHSFYRNWIEEIIHKTRPILEEVVPEHLLTEIEEEKLRKLDNR